MLGSGSLNTAASDPKQIFPLLAWFVFAAILTARTGFGFRGRKSAYLMIAGLAFALMTVFGIAL